MKLKPLTDEKIEEMRRAGLGKGEGANYQPWIHVQDFDSCGQSRRVPSPVVGGRGIHCFSNSEYWIVLMLENESDVIDIREQFPLNRQDTQAVAAELQIKHPCYPRTKVPMVMTVDFLVTRLIQGMKRYEAIECKDEAGLSNIEKLTRICIPKTVCERESTPYRLVNKADLPRNRIRNLEWIRGGFIHEDEVEPSPGYFDIARQRFIQCVGRATLSLEPLNCFCEAFDRTYGYQQGTGLKVARQTMYLKQVSADLDHPELHRAPISSFQVRNEGSSTGTQE